MRALDAATGMLSEERQQAVLRLPAGQNPNTLHHKKFDPEHLAVPPDWQAIEAPFIVAHDGFYYLLVPGIYVAAVLNSTYRTMVDESKSVTGPVRGQDGNAHDAENGGNSSASAPNKRWLGRGESVLLQADGNDRDRFSRLRRHNRKPALQISSIVWQDGWPIAALTRERLMKNRKRTPVLATLLLKRKLLDYRMIGL